MTYTIEQIAQTLKAAREDKGLSQRALAKLAGVPQSHISKIESGVVDLRLSSLVEIARALDLEMTLVPRKDFPAVQSILRRGREQAPGGGAAAKELQRLQMRLSQIAQRYPELKEIAQVQRRARELAHFQLPASYAKKLQDTRRGLQVFIQGKKDMAVLKDALTGIQNLRNELAHDEYGSRRADSVKSAYSLEDDDHG